MQPPASQASQGRPCSPLTSLPSLQVIDHSGARLGEYEDVSKVEKYQISQEAYDQRQGTGTEGWMGHVGARRSLCGWTEVGGRQGHCGEVGGVGNGDRQT